MKLSRTGRVVAASALVPALLLGTGGAALAASNTLTLTALNRSGAKVKISATVVNVATNGVYTIKSGTAKKLPKGTYAVLAQITTGSTSTLAGKTVAVSGSSKLTIDARQGKKVGLALSPAPAGLTPQITARICAQPGTYDHVEAYGDQVYVVPTTSKKIRFASLAAWTDGSGTSDSYAVLNEATGVPSHPTRTFSRSSLGTVTVDSRRGPGGTNTSEVAIQPSAQNCSLDMYANMVSTDVPTNSKLRLSAASWSIRSDEWASNTKTGDNYDIGNYFTNRKVVAGKSYGVRFYGTAWGPGALLPLQSAGTIQYDMNDGFEDPAYPAAMGSVEGGDKATATLQFQGKTVKTTKDTGWMANTTFLTYNVKKSGWYTLTNTATRYYPTIAYPAGMLSTKSVATYRFQAKPKTTALAQVYALQMTPTGLDRYNRAKPNTTTNVAFKLTRQHLMDVNTGKSPGIKSVTATMSTNGTTWKSVTVKKINGTWTALVPNPTSGAVSLRARVTTPTGAYTDITITRAYAIS